MCEREKEREIFNSRVEEKKKEKRKKKSEESTSGVDEEKKIMSKVKSA